MPTDDSLAAGLWNTNPFEQRHVQTSKGIVEYADLGQGIPILYFHGNDVGNDSVVMMEKSLLDDGFRLIAPNRPGYYGTPVTSGRTPSDCADLSAELLDQLRIERAVIIGTSAGGAAACRFAACHPQKTAGLVLQCTCRTASIPAAGCRTASACCCPSSAISRSFDQSCGSAIANKPAS